MIRPPRKLADDEIEELLALELLARLATLDSRGYPHVTPLWFVWSDGAFHMTSFFDSPHLRRLERNPHAGLCVDQEGDVGPDGERPNRQVRAIGEAELFPDADGEWTRLTTLKYVHGPGASEQAAARTAADRVVVRLRPVRLVAVGSV